jgi:carbonic anhydrase
MYEMVFHIGSEHTIGGVNYDLEAQIYYMAVTSGHVKKSAAVSILFMVTPGAQNLFFEKDINLVELPDKYDREKVIEGGINLKDIFLSNANEKFLEFSYYEYEGSISAPPCREDTTWYVVADPIPISYTTVETFKDAIKTLNEEYLSDDLLLMSENALEPTFPDSNRSIQHLNGREIYYYESPIRKGKNKEKSN